MTQYSSAQPRPHTPPLPMSAWLARHQAPRQTLWDRLPKPLQIVRRRIVEEIVA